MLLDLFSGTLFADERAPWKRIQQNTFTRWVNEQLKCIDERVDDLETDLSDGVALIHLVQVQLAQERITQSAFLKVLSQKKVSRYNKKPTFRSQKLENVSMALNFLEKEEKITLVSLGAYCGKGACAHVFTITTVIA